MSITPPPPEDDRTSIGRNSSREQHASGALQIDVNQSKVFQTIPRTPRLQRPDNNTQVYVAGDLSESKDPFMANVASHQPSPSNHGATSQATAFNRTLSDPLPFPSNEPVEQLPFPSSTPG